MTALAPAPGASRPIRYLIPWNVWRAAAQRYRPSRDPYFKLTHTQLTHRTYKERYLKKPWLTNMVNAAPPRRRACAVMGQRPSPRGREDQTACKPGSVPPAFADAAAIPLDRPLLDGSRDLPGRLGRRALPRIGIRGATSLFGLAPGGACHAASIAGDAVRSYRTLSPLPWARGPRRFAFCGAIPGVAPGGRYPPPFRRGARTFLPFPCRKERPPGRLVRAEIGRGGAQGQVGRQARRQDSLSSAISRARVSPSAMPSTFSGRQCRWKAVTVVAQASS